MKYLIQSWFVVCILSYSPISFSKDENAIKEEIIRQSISQYQGNCPCPYNLDRAGRRCGKRSAYSRPGGYSPICYPGDVTDDMVKAYVNSNR